MNKRIHYSRFFYLLLLFLSTTVFYSCQLEDISKDYLETSDLTLDNDQEGFTLSNYNDEWVRDNLIVDWKSPIIIKMTENTIVKEFSTNGIQFPSPENTKDSYQLKIIYKVLKTTTGPKSSYSIVQFQSFHDNNPITLQAMSLKNMNQFDGGVAYSNLLGDAVKLDVY